MQPTNYGQQFYQPQYGLPMAMPPQYHGLPYDDQQFYQPEIYSDMMQPSPMNNTAINSEDFPDRNDAKPRLAKQEVELLERHFQENHKPPSSLKRQLAENMNVQVCRINNWFQNRRAKAKHEVKQAQRLLRIERSQSGEPETEEYDLSKEFSEMFEEEQKPASEDEPKRPRSGSAQETASYNQKYEAPVASSSQSLEHAELDNQAAYQQHHYNFEFDHQSDGDQFGATIYESLGEMDHTQFQGSANSIDYEDNGFTTSPTSMENLDRKPMMMSMPNAAPNYSRKFPAQGSSNPSKATFPSQLLAGKQSQGSLRTIPDDMGDGRRASETSQEGATMRFMSPPPSADIASRRSKRRPAPIGTEAIRDRASPRMKTPLTAAPQRRATKSPGIGVRRAASIGAGLNVLGSRVSKSIAPLSQSPLRPHFPHELKKFAGMDSQVNLIQTSNGIAPPTPRSPNEIAGGAQFYMDEESKQYSHISEQEYDILSANQDPSSGYFAPYDLGFSPPETPGGGYHWTGGFDVADSALHTPGLGSFPSDEFAIQMPQPLQIPQYVSAPTDHPDSSTSHIQGPVSDLYHPQMPISQQYLSSHGSDLSVSPQSSCNNIAYGNNNAQFDATGLEGKLHVQYQWDQQGSDYLHTLSEHSSPDQSRNQGLVFHNATPRDFEGKPISGSP
ncbi:hypothetical protein V496_09015 [Pseudogymnoascus sp. VKM F-4515 (FW-2607)]|nr:hypothetical protein V496_09015 [Pseudogymnoascus sp. VKM F-4515 (FW-2607)]KFY68338.1 hypothetical protein V498_10660 [Pseudogymnoascus sp. VKM F-4517 (FW-2822)]